MRLILAEAVLAHGADSGVLTFAFPRRAVGASSMQVFGHLYARFPAGRRVGADMATLGSQSCRYYAAIAMLLAVLVLPCFTRSGDLGSLSCLALHYVEPMRPHTWGFWHLYYTPKCAFLQLLRKQSVHSRRRGLRGVRGGNGPALQAIRPAASGPHMPSRGLALGPGSNSLFPTLKDPWGRQPLRHRRSRHNARHSRSGTASP